MIRNIDPGDASPEGAFHTKLALARRVRDQQQHRWPPATRALRAASS
jgi:hypothetical protein